MYPNLVRSSICNGSYFVLFRDLTVKNGNFELTVFNKLLIKTLKNQILRVVRDRISRWDINDDQDYDRHSNEDNLDMYLSRGDFARLAPQTPLNNHIINRFLHVLSIKYPDVYPVKCGTWYLLFHMWGTTK